jgi:predicted Ser/Thr protein kinase
VSSHGTQDGTRLPVVQVTEKGASELAQQMSTIAAAVEHRFKAGRRVLSFAEYLELFASDPTRHSRDASRYLRDALDHYGTTRVEYPWGEFTRYRLFDLPWDKDDRTADGRARGALIGQEHVQDELYRAISNFAREGRPNRLILLHGPNGSSKSTIAYCLMAALQHYSTLDEGALYRFHWVFPSSKTIRGALGFGQRGDAAPAEAPSSFAHLADDQIDAKLIVEVRDHPLFLIPLTERRAMVEGLLRDARARAGKVAEGAIEPLCDWLVRGQLSHKSQLVFEALLSSYHGSYTEVLKHVQVERYFISQRYRVGAVTIGPQMHVDASERQVTADRSLTALPASLQALTLYETQGELVEAAGGLLEFSDLLKRPLDAFKYLQLSIETGEVALTQQNVQLNCVMVGSANELHLDAFREHPEFPSFRGRLELVRTPYLRSYLQEQAIYDTHVVSQVKRHVAPHATRAAAMFAVLTRMRRPSVDRYPRPLDSAVGGLTALEKMELYTTGRAPARLDRDLQKLVSSSVKDLHDETHDAPVYEGRIGASPREMQGVLLDASQSTRYRCLSPLAVLDEIEALCERKSEFEWLQQEVVTGGYHDVKEFRSVTLERILDLWEEELYTASGFVDEERYAELFDRYVQHVNVWTRNERIRNRLTGDYEEPDEKLMQEVERLLGIKGSVDAPRRQLISGFAAWALDHPGQKVEPATVFPQHLRTMREAVLAERKPAVARLTRDIVVLTRESGAGLDAQRRKDAEQALQRLVKLGYCESCAADAASTLLRRRFHELV